MNIKLIVKGHYGRGRNISTPRLNTEVDSLLICMMI